MNTSVAGSWLIPDDAPIDWRSKCFGAAQYGRTIADLARAGTHVSDLPKPLLTLDAGALESNIATMAAYLGETGALLSPHGKTTMAPQLWRRQLDAGAWALTVATFWQLRVAVQFGVTRIQHANALVDAADLAALARMMDANPQLEVFVWADSPETVRLTAAGFGDASRTLNVLVDRGDPGARTGARTLDDARATAQAVAAAPNLRLAGVAAWEGSLDGSHDVGGRGLVAQFCRHVADTFSALVSDGLLRPADEPIITGGGSAFFDIMVDEWSALREIGARIVLRSGCYLTHDDGEYARSSPFGRAAGSALTPALHIWAQVISCPEPTLALVNAGRRDVPFDIDLPIPQRVMRPGATPATAPLDGARLTAVNDQHGYLHLAAASTLALGDVVRLGISHPCTAFDKWTTIPVIDDADSDDPLVIGAVRTYF